MATRANHQAIKPIAQWQIALLVAFNSVYGIAANVLDRCDAYQLTA
jgi:hypothetical protein